MKASRLKFLILSIPAATVMFPFSGAHAALRVTNSAMVQNQIQANAMRNAMMQSATQSQVARTVTNANGETISVSNEEFDRCASIYPGGVFDWATPTAGTKSGGGATCVALVEMRSYKNPNSPTYTVLANDYVAAGDSVKCNIDYFRNLTLAGREFVYPADNPPTIADVESVMAQEQKSNAGFKILGAALVGGIGGNLLGKPELGNDSMLGLGADKLKTTAIGATAAAALMTASTQSNDYKTGTVILSTGVNAAAGAVAGNLAATGDDVLKIADCPDTGALNGKKCLYGVVERKNNSTKDKADPDYTWYYNLTNHNMVECKNDTPNSCITISLSNVKFEKSECDAKCDDNIKTDKCQNCLKENFTDSDKYKICNKTMVKKADPVSCKETDSEYIKIVKGTPAGRRVPAMIEFNEPDKLFGYKYADWSKLKTEKYGKATVYNARGDKDENLSAENFYPSLQSADDGAVVDFENRARTKSTLVGAGGGAALGAIAGAAGADSAITERWTTAVREYEDSLGNILCLTGDRFLAKYNDIAIIPAMKE